MAPENSYDGVMSCGDDSLDLGTMPPTKSHEGAISTSPGSSEEVSMIENCDGKAKSEKLNQSSANHKKEPSSKKQKRARARWKPMKYGA